MDDYLEREIELNQIHEDILARREVLLRHSEWHLGSLEKKKKSAADELILANARNQSLIEDVKRVETELRRNAVKGNSPKLQALKDNYWSMVEKDLPHWKLEVKSARKSPRSPRPPQAPIH